jgi:Tfp pilus assembly protein PilO
VTLTDRDRKIAVFVVPLLALAVYWFVLLAPKREEASKAAADLTVQEERRDAAASRVSQLAGDRTRFAADYAEMVRLGKAVPERIDMPTLLVQLEAAARGTQIEFISIAAEPREAAPAPVPTTTPGSDGSQPAAAAGAPAQSGTGTAAESAGNSVAAANANNTASAQQSGVNPSDTQTSATAREGGLPVGGGTATAPAADGSVVTAPTALETVPLTLDFTGNFMDLSTFFHELKRYVRTARNDVLVRGRLLTIEGVEFTSTPESFPNVVATVSATAYLAPRSEGATAGATPSGPTTTQVASPAPTTPAPPTATATP